MADRALSHGLAQKQTHDTRHEGSLSKQRKIQVNKPSIYTHGTLPRPTVVRLEPRPLDSSSRTTQALRDNPWAWDEVTENGRLLVRHAQVPSHEGMLAVCAALPHCALFGPASPSSPFLRPRLPVSHRPWFAVCQRHPFSASVYRRGAFGPWKTDETD